LKSTIEYFSEEDLIDKKMKQISLSRKQVTFLDKVSTDCHLSGGKKFTRAEILKAILTVIHSLKINVDDMQTQKALQEKMCLVFKEIR
jgi:hypothetical protein